MAYLPPTSDDLIARYPAFAAVDPDTIDSWLNAAEEDCALFPEDVRARAEMAFAAAKMAEIGLGAGAVPAGVTSFKSADFSATIADTVAARVGFDASPYGREFKQLQRRYFGGPVLMGCR